jgi:hypothetical protein
VVHGGEEACELIDVIGFESAFEEHRFPVAVRRGHGGHGEQVLCGVFEDEFGHGTGGEDLGEPAHAEGFAGDAFGRAEPFDLHAEFGEGLFEHPLFAGLAGDEHGAIGDAAAQHAHFGRLVLSDAAALAEVGEQCSGVFDVHLDRR